MPSEEDKLMKHPVIKNKLIVKKMLNRRGRLHAFEILNFKNSALVVIDLMSASTNADDRCRDIIPQVNDFASFVRNAGGLVSWVTQKSLEISSLQEQIFGYKIARQHHNHAQDDEPDAKRRLSNR